MLKSEWNIGDYIVNVNNYNDYGIILDISYDEVIIYWFSNLHLDLINGEVDIFLHDLFDLSEFYIIDKERNFNKDMENLLL